jgi:hypothetical protein
MPLNHRFLTISESYCLEYEVRYFGEEAAPFIDWVPGASQCQFECQIRDGCQYITYNTRVGASLIKLFSLSLTLLGPYSQHIVFHVTYNWFHQAGVFAPGRVVNYRVGSWL